jgi:predicted nucleotidyltransferase
MPSLAAIRERRRSDRLAALRQGAAAVLAAHPGCEIWLFGSLARGDWDACSDVDLLAVAPTKGAADALADALLEAQLGDDVLALTSAEWQRLRAGDDPYWQAIGRDALRLDRP